MDRLNTLVINTDEKFQVLKNAPVIEAIIDIRTQNSEKLEEKSARKTIEDRLPDFIFLDSQREVEHQLKITGENPPEQCIRDLGWRGVRFQSDDQKKIIQLNRDGFVSSRLEPYKDWSSFAEEALLIWGVYCEIAQPENINRLGLRYINRIDLPAYDYRLEDYLLSTPSSPKGLNLPFYGFMHHETLAVPNHPFAVNLIRTLQPPQADGNKGPGLILDIDVFTLPSFNLDSDNVPEALNKMRWLKNKVFFGSMSEKALEAMT